MGCPQDRHFLLEPSNTDSEAGKASVIPVMSFITQRQNKYTQRQVICLFEPLHGSTLLGLSFFRGSQFPAAAVARLHHRFSYNNRVSYTRSAALEYLFGSG